MVTCFAPCSTAYQWLLIELLQLHSAQFSRMVARPSNGVSAMHLASAAPQIAIDCICVGE